MVLGSISEGCTGGPSRLRSLSINLQNSYGGVALPRVNCDL